MIRAKEYLLSISKLDAQVKMWEAEKQYLEEQRLVITASMSTDRGSGGGGPSDKVGNLSARILDLERSIDKHKRGLIERRQEALHLLEKLPDQSHMTLLHRKYFLHQDWVKIRKDMGYSERGAYSVHGRALQALDILLQASEENEKK